ncbi:hypothetical protein VN97_g9563 [Penicillium thymicola]|uniref:Uncharacterized protein n=1 Tax=Penicillium thymicola TaxID=293382 RepID=A0AAI9TBE0_PENTH|nr:hypothetical protein VN97_g9563 [Penicillium thymicola]
MISLGYINLGKDLCHRHITLSLVITHNSLPYKDSPTLKLAAKRSANFPQIQFRFTSDDGLMSTLLTWII